MTEPMNSADVPAELVFVAGLALEQAPDADDGGQTELRAMLAAVLPLHEQQVRERVLAEVAQEAAHERWMRGDDDV